MEDVILGLMIVAAITIVLFVGALLYEWCRRSYYWVAAKIYEWSEDEKFERETAWLDRVVARDQRLAKRDAAGARDTYRRRFGVYLITVAIGVVALQSLVWWQVLFVAAAVYAGMTMAAGLAWKW
jgi:hypothetical protein